MNEGIGAAFTWPNVRIECNQSQLIGMPERNCGSLAVHCKTVPRERCDLRHTSATLVTLPGKRVPGVAAAPLGLPLGAARPVL